MPTAKTALLVVEELERKVEKLERHVRGHPSLIGTWDRIHEVARVKGFPFRILDPRFQLDVIRIFAGDPAVVELERCITEMGAVFKRLLQMYVETGHSLNVQDLGEEKDSFDAELTRLRGAVAYIRADVLSWED